MPTTSDIKAYMQHALWVSEWVTEVLWKKMERWKTSGTHCEAPHWCVHPQDTEGWRDQPERSEREKGECPKRPQLLRQRLVNDGSQLAVKRGRKNKLRSYKWNQFDSIYPCVPTSAFFSQLRALPGPQNLKSVGWLEGFYLFLFFFL